MAYVFVSLWCSSELSAWTHIFSLYTVHMLKTLYFKSSQQSIIFQTACLSVWVLEAVLKLSCLINPIITDGSVDPIPAILRPPLMYRELFFTFSSLYIVFMCHRFCNQLCISHIFFFYVRFPSMGIFVFVCVSIIASHATTNPDRWPLSLSLSLLLLYCSLIHTQETKNWIKQKI